MRQSPTKRQRQEQDSLGRTVGRSSRAGTPSWCVKAKSSGSLRFLKPFRWASFSTPC